MRTVLATNDPVLLSLAQAVLQDAGVDCVVLDAHMSAMDGSIGAIPRRLCVTVDAQFDRALALVRAIEEGA
jgi:hypothetical protein